MAALMVSISGVRGIVGESLTPAIIEKYALAYGSFINRGTIILGRDSRTSGEFINNIVQGCLLATGCKVIDVGIVPTPTVQMEILHHKAQGGIAITASHNPPEWNGLKFMDANGRFLSPDNANKVYSEADKGNFNLQKWDDIGSFKSDKNANKRHIKALLKLPYFDVKELRKRKFKVIVDCVNGAGGLIIPQLLEELGCETKVINGEPNGYFAHTPEPLPENLTELSKTVKKEKADIGFAVDPDVDRCAIIANKGNIIGEEYTLALAVKFILSKELGNVVVNMSTSRASEDIAKYYNCPFIRTKVGEINVAEEMVKSEAIIGGEGNGGVILPELHLGRDAPAAVALTLQALLEFDGSMNELFLSLPQYKIVKKKISIEGLNPDELLQKMGEKHKNKKIDFLDGLKIDTENTWVHLRKSNTEPIIRVMAEAPTEKEAEKLANTYLKEIQSL
ncbi:MAG: phosphoglucosamine mutase [Calditrichia bacterium]|nr:phosphoglucosamine mutase [Calditrichia bacterium]